MLGIATHNSGTGEKPVWWSYPLIPFARCQSKTIKEQYDAGCRLFDIRVRLIGDEWRVAHGLFVIKKTAEEIFSELNSFPEKVYINLMYEGKCDCPPEFQTYVEHLKDRFPNIGYGGANIKYGYQNPLIKAPSGWIDKPQESKFVVLDGHSWHTYLPLPWLWKKIYYDKPEFTEDKYTYVDFL